MVLLGDFIFDLLLPLCFAIICYNNNAEVKI